MTVSTFKKDSFTVEIKHGILDLYMSEAGFTAYIFVGFTALIPQGDDNIIKVGLFCTPEINKGQRSLQDCLIAVFYRKGIRCNNITLCIVSRKLKLRIILFFTKKNFGTK